MSDGIVNEHKFIYILPRIRLSGNRLNEERFSIGKADFLPDEQSSWDDVIQLPRPDWLDIYKQFPYLDLTESPKPARGTLVISDDEDWLKKHISRLISMVYIFGLNHNKWQVPADAFHYSLFKATKTPQQLVEFFTKSNSKIEDLSSLSLFPPLELRGVSSSYQIDLHNSPHIELIRKFNENPHDRLVVACFHLFRSQYDNPVVSPSEQDISAFCACLEAALNIEGQDYSKSLVDELTKIYGSLPEMDRWIKGLYAERSVFNHGVSTEPTLDSADDRVRALAEFRQRSINWDVLRKLCLDTIEQQLQDAIDPVQRTLSRLINSTQRMVEKYFCSEEIWGETSNYFTQKEAVDKILKLQGDDEVEFFKLCDSYLNKHSWQCMTKEINLNKVYNSLKTMAAVFSNYPKGDDDGQNKDSAEKLFNSAHEGKNEEINAWARSYANYEKEYGVEDKGDAARAVALHTAMLFVTLNQEKK